jgi:hypothetical protein
MKNANLLDQDLCRPLFAAAMRNISSRARAQNNWSSVSQNMNQRTAVAPNQAEAEIKSQQRRVSSSRASLRAGKVRCPSLLPLTMLQHHTFGLSHLVGIQRLSRWYSTKASIKIFSHASTRSVFKPESDFAFSVFAQRGDDFTSFATHTKRLLMKWKFFSQWHSF